MSEGATKDYKFGPKNNWRRWLWNRIEERLTVPTRDALVLYLAGSTDLDRQEAIRRGFAADNLIAIERDTEVAQSLRSAGKLCLVGDFADVLSSWPSHRHVHVIVGDFCSGLENDLVHGMSDWYHAHQAFRGAVWAFNFMRGRDPSSNEIRKKFLEIGFVSPEDYGFQKDFVKHRGMILLRAICHQFEFAQSLRDESGATKDTTRTAEAMKWLIAHMAPSVSSYKSGALTFDSTVFRGVYQFMPSNPAHDPAFVSKYIKDRWGATLTKNVSAVLAHRTMRINRTGPYA